MIKLAKEIVPNAVRIHPLPLYYPRTSTSHLMAWSQSFTNKARDVYTLNFLEYWEYQDTIAKLEKINKSSLLKLYFEEQFSFDNFFTLDQIKKIFEYNILELRVTHIIEKVEVVDIFCEWLKRNTKLRDLELLLDDTQFVEKLLNALSKNYMIKTVRLMTKKVVSK